MYLFFSFFFFYGGGAEARRSKATCSRAHNQPIAKLDSNLGLSDSKVSVLSSHDVQQVNRENLDRTFPVHCFWKTPSKAESWVE